MKNDRPNGRPGVAAAAAVLLTVLTASAGCGNLTMGGFGNARVVVSGNDQGVAPSLAAISADGAVGPSSGVIGRATAAPALADGIDEPEGQIEVDFRLYLISETGAATQLGEDQIEVRVDLRGETEADAVQEQVPVARYLELQVVFTDIRAEVDAGLIINGVPVTGEIRVEFDDVTLLVPKPIDVDVTAGADVVFVLDLNAPSWLQAVDPVTATVDPTVFADLITISTR